MSNQIPIEIPLMNHARKNVRFFMYIFLPLVAFWGLLIGASLLSAVFPKFRMIAWHIFRPIGLSIVLLVFLNWQKNIFIKPVFKLLIVVLSIALGLGLCWSFIPDLVSKTIMPPSKSLIDLVEFYHLKLDHISWIYYVSIGIKIISITVEELYYRGFAFAEFYTESKFKFWAISLIGYLLIHPWSHEWVIGAFASIIATEIMIKTKNVCYCISFRYMFHLTSLVLWISRA